MWPCGWQCPFDGTPWVMRMDTRRRCRALHSVCTLSGSLRTTSPTRHTPERVRFLRESLTMLVPGSCYTNPFSIILMMAILTMSPWHAFGLHQQMSLTIPSLLHMSANLNSSFFTFSFTNHCSLSHSVYN